MKGRLRRFGLALSLEARSEDADPLGAASHRGLGSRRCRRNLESSLEEAFEEEGLHQGWTGRMTDRRQGLRHQPPENCLERRGIEAVIPSSARRKPLIPHDRGAYRQRNLIERMVARLKDFRRIATRYDKLARNYLATVLLAAATTWWWT